ncbi:hypothetical protein E2P81_ATG03159 [Venturia nashicola]|nr:hypothetical protein E2P81_ATG03159 [Venturia nashicola]
MLPLKHLFFLLAPAAVLSAPHPESNDGNLETAASQLSSRAGYADAPFRSSIHVEPHHVIELRHDQISDDTFIEIPSDQMSGRVRVTYDPALDPIHKANDESLQQGTSPVPVSELVKRSVQTEGDCNKYHGQNGGFLPPNAVWHLRRAYCAPPDPDPRLYNVECFSGDMHSGPMEKSCPPNTICYQLPTAWWQKDKRDDIVCKPEDSTTKVASSLLRGMVKTITKVFAKPPAGYTRIMHEVTTFDNNMHSFQVYNIIGLSDGHVMKDRPNSNGIIYEHIAKANGEKIFWEADAGRSWAVVEWTWKRTA